VDHRPAGFVAVGLDREHLYSLIWLTVVLDPRRTKG
jgi:hypothetical protein